MGNAHDVQLLLAAAGSAQINWGVESSRQQTYPPWQPAWLVGTESVNINCIEFDIQGVSDKTRILLTSRL